MKRVLITGSHSYVGGWVKSRLEEDPESFTVAELSVRGDAWKTFDFSVYDCIFHAAGIAHVSVDPSMASEYMRVNRDLAIEVGAHAKAQGVRHFIFMSSAIVYGDAVPAGKGRAITPDTPPVPANFYGQSKLEAEEGLKTLEDANFKVATLRTPMVYGPRCTKGNFPLLVNLAKKLPIFPEINNRRSMIYVKNLAELVVQVAKHEASGLFFPQNADYVRTCDLIKAVTNEANKRVVLTKVFNPALNTMLANVPVVKKAFGDLFFAHGIDALNFDYRTYDLSESVHDIAVEEGWVR